GRGWCGATRPPEGRGPDRAGRAPSAPPAPGDRGDYPLPPSVAPLLQDPPQPATPVLLPLRSGSLVLMPTLSAASPPRAGIEALTVASTPVTLLLQQTVRTPGSNFNAVSVHQNNMIALSAFLDVSGRLNSSFYLALGQDPDITLEAAPARGSASVASDWEALSLLIEPALGEAETQAGTGGASGLLSPPGPAQDTLVRVFSEIRPGSPSQP